MTPPVTGHGYSNGYSSQCLTALRRSRPGLDLKQRPLGYEGKSNPHRNQDEPTQTNDDEALLNGSVGLFWLISVGLLHSTFIASRGCADEWRDRRRRPRFNHVPSDPAKPPSGCETRSGTRE